MSINLLSKLTGQRTLAPWLDLWTSPQHSAI